MKKMKLINILLSLFAIFYAFISVANSTDSSTLSLNVQPTSIEVSYGAVNQQIPLTFYVVNNASYAQDLSNYQLTTNPPNNNITVGAITDNCGGQIPKQGSTGVCTISVTLTANNPSPGPIPTASYQFSLQYGAGRPTIPLTSNPFPVSFATGELQPELSRTFTFVNNCSQDIYIGISSGATNPKNTPYVPGEIPPPCDTSPSATNGCYPGSTCSTAVTPHVCFWDNPVPTSTQSNPYHLPGGMNPPSTAMAVFPAYDNGVDLIWNGGIAGRTGCSSSGASSCTTADCEGTDGEACLLTKGFATPSSILEFSLLNQMPIVTSNTPNGNTDVDTYDISIINGITVPISIEPTTTAWGGPSAPYTCGAPGSAEPRLPLGACVWDPIVSPSYHLQDSRYVWVSYNATPTSCSSCTNPTEPCNTCSSLSPSGQVCGTSVSGSTVNPYVCGEPLGYWTADQLCGTDSGNNIVPNACGNQPPALPSPQPQLPVGATFADLYQCKNGLKNSCYTAGAQEGNCCGCQDWDKLNPPITIPSTTSGLTPSCNSVENPYWGLYSLPLLEWLKATCPTAYAYPYDDKSSTFTCQTLNEQNVNVTNYTVTFCPLTPVK